MTVSAKLTVVAVIIQTRKLNEINLEDSEKSKRDSYVDSSKSFSVFTMYIFTCRNSLNKLSLRIYSKH